ncbi:hypothetical protein [Streptomyces calidiresistens]|uniref:Uncharacterized protein n=1 Tax=Streptomyces calidiresistens TaxID=1485586 RepID=A0A7W3T397_9ACTN|nr:hypothetical protein [Streptomyces calidiresistens]MBB0230133.1 hypothetical protein [Streptomyces calidiresistens]
MVIVATLAAIASNFFEIGDQLNRGEGTAAIGDLILTSAFCALFGLFAEMVRAGRQWGRVLLTIFTGLGLLFTGLGLLGVGRPFVGPLQGSLAALSFITSVVGLVLLYAPSANRWLSRVRDGNRMISPRLRKVILTIHVMVGVGWLGLVTGMSAMMASAVLTGSAEHQAAMYRTLGLLDDLFLGMTSMFTLISGILVSTGTKWGLMRRRWVVTKFFTTMGLMLFGFSVIHPLIIRANELVESGAPVRGGELDTVGWAMTASSVLALLTLVFMTTLSTYKPWGPTRWGRPSRTAAR